MIKEEKSTIDSLPVLPESSVRLLEELSNAVGVSGNENEIRSIIRREVSSVADNLTTDTIGNLIAVKHAKNDHALRVMVAAHMDEVGFMIVDKESDGIFKFQVVGGIDERALAGKAVQVGKKHAPGVIGACPVHLSTPAEREVILKTDNLRIDTGPGSKDIEVGDYATFATKFKRMGGSFCGKAIDNRIGVATLIELLKNAPDSIELIAAFTVQEEVGLRGAEVAAYNINPDFAFVIDCTPANDQPAWDHSENTLYRTKLDQGPAIYTNDSRTLYDHRLIRYLSDLGDRYGIRYQYRQPASGGTDAGAIHTSRSGIPTISLSVPGRYTHTAASIIRKADWEDHYRLMTVALRHIDADILKENR
ncbi:MAG TPA: hypothetical protein PKX76_04940 [Flexilinea sp.]|nr:hypothetical protein [Flexilinea sp.]HOR55270.1 hypothetical protein [Flexilinea sp.]